MSAQSRFVLKALSVGAALLVSAGTPMAAPFTIATDICQDVSCTGTAATYIGAGTSGGYVGTSLDGGSDAFDFFGYLNFDSGVLSVSRRAEALSAINTYRWVDSFTNTTGGHITRNVTFSGDLGSDGSEAVSTNTNYVIVSRDNFGGSNNYDPVLGLVNGNNAYAATMNVAVTPNIYTSTFVIDLDAGQSVSIAHFAHLGRPDDIYNCFTANNGPGEYCFGQNLYDAVGSGTVASVTAFRQVLVAIPYFAGLSGGEIASIINFNAGNSVPAPASAALLLIGLAGFRLRRAKG
jgi:hypothetical protein